MNRIFAVGNYVIECAKIVTIVTRATFVEDGDILAYWYQVDIPNLDAATAIYYVTCGEGEFRRVEDLWDGVPIAVARFWYKKTGVSDFTDEVNVSHELYFAEISNMTTADEIVIGFSQRMRGFNIGVINLKGNAVVSGASVAFWGGTGWSGVTGLYDGTSGGQSVGKTISQDGIMHFIPSEEMSTDPLEVKRTYNSNEMLYYYRIKVSVNLTADTQIYYVAGIPAQPAKGDFKLIDKYRFPIEYQGRFFLASHENEANRVVYSAFEKPDVFNGTDSGEFRVGDRQAITAGGVVYNIFRTTAYEQLIMTKASETWRIAGTGPENWVLTQVSPNIGCVAPQSFVVCDGVDTEQGKRNVAIWQAAHGFVWCDGAAPKDISDSIDVYFDKNDPRGISEHRIDDTRAWYNPDNQTYTALISSGAENKDAWGDDDVWYNDPVEAWGIDWESAIVTHNVELEYSLKYNEWTKLARYTGGVMPTALPLQVGFQTKDSDGKIYTYGAANNGIMYRLENGNSWHGTGITQFVKTKDLLIDDKNPAGLHTTFETLRVMFASKSGVSPYENITIEHWGDGLKTVTGVSNETLPYPIPMDDIDGRDTQSVRLGPNLTHAFKITAVTDSLDDGMELLGIAGLYKSLDTWKE